MYKSEVNVYMSRIDNIDIVVIEADMQVICSLSDYYYKQSIICENSDIVQEGFSIREAGRKLWKMFINALKVIQRWFHRKTKYVFMKKRMERATPKEIKKFEDSLKIIGEFLDDVNEVFDKSLSDEYFLTSWNMMQAYYDRLEVVCKDKYLIFGGKEGEL